MEQIAAKPTTYNGYLFRSKLEAKWAVFFDLIGVPYMYEPEAFRCKDGSQYTPDFYLPESFLRGQSGKRLYMEIKPIGFTTHYGPENDRYIKRIASSLPNDNLCLFVGEPYDLLFGEWNPENLQLCPYYDNYMVLMYCVECSVLKVDFREGNYMYCPCCGGDISIDAMKPFAIDARQYRFDYLK